MLSMIVPVAADSVTNFGPTADGKTFAGKAPAGVSVAISTDGYATTVASVVADASGLWTYTFDSAPSNVTVSARALTRADFSVSSRVVISGTPGPATVGTFYSFIPATSGGSGTKAFSLTGALPAGLSFSSASGAFSGTPTTAGTFALRLTVTDANGATTALDVTIAVAAMPAGRVAELTRQVNGLAAAPAPQSMWNLQASEAIDPDMHPHMGTFTHTAAQNGLWSDPATWVGGVVPGSAADTIADRSTVNVNTSKFEVVFDLYMDKAKAINGIHVSGAGTFKASITTKSRLYVDTLMVHGTTVMGEWNAFVPESATPGEAFFEIIFLAQQAPGTTTRLGLMTMGPVRMHGAQKTARLRATATIPAGSTQIAFPSLAGSGWRVGDKVLVLATDDAGAISVDPQYKGPTKFYGNYKGVAGLQYSTQLGYKQSHDEVRTIAAINGDTITLDSALTYAHTRVTDVLPRGNTVDLKPPVCNLSRSILMRSAEVSEGGDPSVLQKRAHTMFMHSDDVDVRYVEGRNLARSDTNPTLATDQQVFDSNQVVQDFILLTDTPANGGVLMSDPLNVRGRYAFHLHGSGPYLSRRQCVLKSVVAWAPTDQVPLPGWGIVQHNARAAFEDLVTYNIRGAGVVTENGNEIGQWVGCTSAWNRGDGYETVWSSRAERIQNHNGHAGVAFESQSRNILNHDNISTSSHYGWLYMQQATAATLLNPGSMAKRIPDEYSLRYRDPLASNIPMTSYVDDGVDYAIGANTYGIEEAQIPDFDDNVCYGVMSPLFVAHRPTTDREDMTPMVAKRNHAISCRHAFHLEEYSFNYSFLDALWIGLGKTDETKNWATSLGPIVWQMNFSNIKAKNYAVAFLDGGININYNGFFVDVDVSDCAKGFKTPPIIMATDPALHPLNGVMGPWEVTPLGNGTWSVVLGAWKALSLASDLPLDRKSGNLPKGPSNVTAEPAAMVGMPRPYFWLDEAASSRTVTPTGLSTIVLTGVIGDNVGLRRWSDHVIFYPETTTVAAGGPRKNFSTTGTRLVKRNGCFLDNGVWKTPLWFTDHDRTTGEYLHFRVDITLSNFTGTIDGMPAADFLAKYTVDPTVYNKMPLLPEIVGTPRDRVIPSTPPVIVTDNFAWDENTTLGIVLQCSGVEHPSWSIDTDTTTPGNEDASKFQVAGITLTLAGGAVTNYKSDVSKDFELPDDADANGVYKVRLLCKDAWGNTAAKAITGTLRDVLEAVTSFTDSFTGTAGQYLSQRTGWTLANGLDRLVIASGGTFLGNDGTAPTSGQSTTYTAPDIGSSDMSAEYTPLNSTEQPFLAVRYVDPVNWIGIQHTTISSQKYIRVVQTLGNYKVQVLADYGVQNALNKKVRIEVVGNTFKVYLAGVALTPVSGSETIPPESQRSNRGALVYFTGQGTPLDDVTFAKLTPANVAASIVNNTLTDQSPWVGQTTFATNAVGAGYPEPTLSYQWQQDTAGNGTFADVTGAQSRSYVPVSGNVGNRLRSGVKVAGGAFVYSAPSDAVAAAKSLPFVEDFEGADEWGENRNGWTLPSGAQAKSFKVTNGKLSIVAPAPDARLALEGPDLGQSGMYVQAVLSRAAGYFVTMRGGNGQWMGIRRATNDAISLFYCSSSNAAGVTLLSLGTFAAASLTAMVRVECIGTAWKLYYDGSLITTGTLTAAQNTALTGRKAGVDVQTRTALADWLSDFGAGPISAFSA